MANNKSKTKLTIGSKNPKLYTRFSYANVFEPKAMDENSKEKYSVCLLIPKEDKKTLAKIKAAIEAAKEIGKNSKFGGKVPKSLKICLRDGDLEREDSPEYAGMMFINCNSNTKPQIVDEDVEEIIDRSEFYSGCYGRASLNFYPFNFNGSKGIAAGLNNIQKLDDGERLSGGSSAADDFGDDDDDMMG